MDITNLDFQQARIKQVLFKSRLRSVLYGVREADDALFSMQQNPLGEWLNTIVKPKYGAYPEVREIERVLQRMLNSGQALVRQYQRGQLEESRTGLEQIDSYADQIAALLQKMEQSSTT
ncbi:hypothetical protein [Hymenobacter sediminicola]|uniref:Uncharacterized protein n=1 Tax=Hymenobacter sediminicola TaxID=2761579 RepID=A0A7G7WAQ7_9BACT|nr:hypothetical protein [Hymenobacter sediminicola]QNH63450.1 hypothetical protein H4317_06550 [Hymenobacter sediminicola]